MRSEFEKLYKEVDGNYLHALERYDADMDYYLNNEYVQMRYNWFCVGWQHQQTKVDELQEMFVEQARTASNQQAKIDDLQKQLIDQGQRFNEQSQRVKDLEFWNGELQKRINACNTLINRWNKEADYADLIAQEDFVQNTLQGCINELEQALKGDGK